MDYQSQRQNNDGAGLREFKIKNKSKELTNKIVKRSSYFKTAEQTFTDYFQIIQKNRTRSVNQYLTHWIYPYKGKFHPQMIRALLNIIGLKAGDTVFEPFSGSGTTALEAQLLGINFIGIDISPLCVMQGKVKTKSIYVIDEIIKLKNSLISKLKPSLFNQEKDFYKTLAGIENEPVRDFYALARLLVDYVENDAHSLEDMGYLLNEIRENFVGVRGKGKERVELYNSDMKKSYSEMYRILKPNKYAVIVIGNATYQGEEVKTVEFTIEYMTKLGFKLEKDILKIIFGLYNVMKKENILIFRKAK
ncbi:MAG: hypothetical protein HZB80_00695 [Deltaproteobacteria bacterium]|nr:hypothetical protein [Deltaproteobacteria bacterium]